MSTPAVRIVTDSACDLPASLVEELGIGVVPLTIRLGGHEYIDREELSPAQFWQLCAAERELPETAAPAPGQFEQMYRAMAADGATSVVTINLSAGLSATMQSAELAARSVADELRVDVIDSRSVTLGLGVMVTECARRARDGATHDEIVALAHHLADTTHVYGALDTLDNLRKGGRIGGAKALLASALAIKPIIEVRDGKVEQAGKQRTRSKALHFLVEKLRAHHGVRNLSVLQADCPDVDAFVAMLQPHFDGEIIIGDIGPVVGSHAGRGTIGIAFHADD